MHNLTLLIQKSTQAVNSWLQQCFCSLNCQLTWGSYFNICSAKVKWVYSWTREQKSPEGRLWGIPISGQLRDAIDCSDAFGFAGCVLKALFEPNIWLHVWSLTEIRRRGWTKPGTDFEKLCFKCCFIFFFLLPTVKVSFSSDPRILNSTPAPLHLWPFIGEACNYHVGQEPDVTL